MLSALYALKGKGDMQKKFGSAVRLAMFLAAAIFLAEFLLMLLLRYWPTLNELKRAFVDSSILIVVLSPVLYFLFYQPIQRQMDARLFAEKELNDKNLELNLFAENVAHSLRSTLNTIVGAAWFLHDKYSKNLKETDANLLSVIERDGRRLLALIDDLLSLVRMKGGEIPRENLDVESLVQEVVQKLNGWPAGGENGVVIGTLPRVYLSRSLLTVALDNLVRNAVLYGRKKGAPVEIYGHKRDGRICLYVRDHGVGVPAAERERVFEVLYRGTGAKHLPGSGIGLALVRKIALVYNGRVSIEETPGGGATFCLELSEEEV
jgi:signal transduction histidine kinase